MEKIAEHFGGLEHNYVEPPEDTTLVFLCFTNRCGSNFLAELIASSGQYNRAGESLNWPGVIDQSKRYRLNSFQEFFAHLVSQQRNSGHFFVKAALPHLELLARSKLLDRIIEKSRFILLERSDKLGQAISHALALETGSFTSNRKSSRTPEQAEFSCERIDRFLAKIAVSYRLFGTFFGWNGIVSLPVTYERLVADPAAEIAWLARELGLPHSGVDVNNLRLERQSGPVNDSWRQRYLDET